MSFPLIRWQSKPMRVVKPTLMDMQPTTHRPLVSHKFKFKFISDQKMKKLYKENKHLLKIFPMKQTRILYLNLISNGSSLKPVLYDT